MTDEVVCKKIAAKHSLSLYLSQLYMYKRLVKNLLQPDNITIYAARQCHYICSLTISLYMQSDNITIKAA